jgi:uncharacterized protein involved in exopolysaccharide biosynthesis
MQKRISFKGGSEEENRTGLAERKNTDVNLFELAGTVLRKKKIIFGATLAVMAIAVLAAILTPNKYMSHASILPSGRMDKMADLKMLAGLGGNILSDENSSQLYPNILGSRTVADAVLRKEYTFRHNDRMMKLSLSDYFDLGNPDYLRKALRKITSVNIDRKTGVIGLGVETEYPGLSQAVLEQYIAELENFNLHHRRSLAKENVRYLEREMVQREKELKRAEDSLEAYQMANRNWEAATDPEILKSLARLERDIEIKSKAYVILTEQHELAKLDAQKDVPIVRILDHPSLPTLKTAPHRMLTVLLSGVIAFISMIFLMVVSDALKKKARESDLNSYNLFRENLDRAFPRAGRFIERYKRLLEKIAS